MQLRGLVVLVGVFALHGAACSDPDAGTSELENACDDYCVLVLRNCTGAVAQYSDLSTCLATCETMELGAEGTEQGNNIECRTFWAAISEGDTTMCTRAGPGGDGTCGMNCESFCASTMQICADEVIPPYDSEAECLTACGGYSATERFDAGDIAGNTFACRLYHMTAASTEPGTHCQHTGVDSAVCL